MTKPRLTIEEHQQLGLRLAAIRDELLHLGTQLTNAYPRTGPEAVPARKLNDALDAVEVARCELDNALFREHPNEGEVTFYYPQTEDRAWHA